MSAMAMFRQVDLGQFILDRVTVPTQNGGQARNSGHENWVLSPTSHRLVYPQAGRRPMGTQNPCPGLMSGMGCYAI